MKPPPHLALLGLSALLLTPGVASAQSPAPCGEAEIQRGNELRRQGLDGEALILFRQAWETCRFTRALGQMGLAAAALGQWSEAARYLGTALADPADPWVQRNRAQLEAVRQRVVSQLGEHEHPAAPPTPEPASRPEPAPVTPDAPRPELAPVTPDAPLDPPRPRLRTVGWVLGAGGLLALGGAGGALAWRESAVSDQRAVSAMLQCFEDDARPLCAEAQGRIARAEVTAITGLILGASLLATSALLLAISPMPPRRAARVACAPGLGVPGLSCGWRF